MYSEKCPVKRAIGRLYAGGRVEEPQHNPKLNISYGDMRFLITCKVMDLARFELTKPTLEQCLLRFLLPRPTPQQYYEKHMMSADKNLFVGLFMRACARVKSIAQKKKDVILPPPIKVCPRELCLAPDVLCKAINWVLQVAGDDKEFPEPTFGFPEVAFPTIPDTLDATSGLKYLQDTQEVEITILDYAAKVEEYQAEAYAKLEEILAV